MGLVTHFQPRCNASQAEDDKSISQTAATRCSGCGNEFEVKRPWQKHCSPRCRVRVHRQTATVQGYYGA